jgi:hypothetical protein
MSPGHIGALIPIVAIVFGIGIGALAVWTEHKRKAQLLDQLHRERMLALEKGVEPPAIASGLVGYLDNNNKKKRIEPRYQWPRAMRTGLWFLFGGTVLYFAIEQAGGHEGAMFALVFAAVGLANLIFAAVLWKQEKDEPPPPRTASFD